MYIIKWRKNSLSNSVGKTRCPHAKKIKLKFYLSMCTGITSKWIKSPNIWHKAIKLLGGDKKLGKVSWHSSWWRFLTSDTTKITGLQKKNQKDGIILNTKTFTHQNTQSIEEKVNLQNGRKYFQITYLIRG